LVRSQGRLAGVGGLGPVQDGEQVAHLFEREVERLHVLDDQQAHHIVVV
jgi:hypothetical protein